MLLSLRGLMNVQHWLVPKALERLQMIEIKRKYISALLTQREVKTAGYWSVIGYHDREQARSEQEWWYNEKARAPAPPLLNSTTVKGKQVRVTVGLGAQSLRYWNWFQFFIVIFVTRENIPEVTTWETVEIRELFALWQIVSLVAVHSSLITAPGSHCEQFKHSCSWLTRSENVPWMVA